MNPDTILAGADRNWTYDPVPRRGAKDAVSGVPHTYRLTASATLTNGWVVRESVRVAARNRSAAKLMAELFTLLHLPPEQVRGGLWIAMGTKDTV
ncbi:MAG: hypothetical protein LBR72_06475 [Oscillospiraceae bacterium]|nr:hypothetical protein [Oscillospiraceae bacterium]